MLFVRVQCLRVWVSVWVCDERALLNIGAARIAEEGDWCDVRGSIGTGRRSSVLLRGGIPETVFEGIGATGGEVSINARELQKMGARHANRRL